MGTKVEFEGVLQETLVSVNRVTKVSEGGRRFSFAAVVVVGNKAGVVGYGSGKAKDIGSARGKALQDAKKSLIKVPLLDFRTFYHEAKGKSGAAKVIIRNAKPGTGIIAGGAMRAVFECLGVSDVVAKSFGSSNPHTMISATIDALKQLSSPLMIAERRKVDLAYLTTEKNKF